jgi:hypothetical protein
MKHIGMSFRMDIQERHGICQFLWILIPFLSSALNKPQKYKIYAGLTEKLGEYSLMVHYQDHLTQQLALEV